MDRGLKKVSFLSINYEYLPNNTLMDAFLFWIINRAFMAMEGMRIDITFPKGPRTRYVGGF